ncbi:MAG: PcfJ domain-containing protein [Chlorobia bacterium]|nr:PcfJ domain-containing protein [Fimbriimonadaceae bacterium]
MGKKKKTEFQLRKEKQAEKDRAYQRTLARVKTKLGESELTGSKRKDVDFLRRYLQIPLGGRFARRSHAAYHGRSYNLRKQALALIDHVFVLYPVPLFLYRATLSAAGHNLVFDPNWEEPDAYRESLNHGYVRWFAVTAQGGSLAKEMRGILTKKEVHWFLKAPGANTIQRNLFWARCAAAGIPLTTCQFLTDRIGGASDQAALGDRRDDLIRFYANEAGQMRENDLQEITDFVRAMVRQPDFSFKGRTLGSMVNLSEAWHGTMYSSKVAKYESWRQQFAPWVHEMKDHTVHAIELTNNRALSDEGKRQRHCVFTYTQSCLSGWSKIVSIRWVMSKGSLLDPTDIVSRLTLEIRPSTGEIVQIRGKLNRTPDEKEGKIIRLWAADHGLRLATWCGL